jgi:hypothetical protein
VSEPCGQEVGYRNKNLVKESSKLGITLGGKKHGSLKESTIVNITEYYRKAIKRNIPNVQQM